MTLIPNLKDLTLRDYQEEAISHALNDNNSDLIVIPTGEGKTIVGLSIINKLNEPALIVCPTIILTKQWVDVIKSFNGNATSISSEGDGIYTDLTVITYASLLRNLNVISNYKVIVFDEAHHVASPEYQKIAFTALENGLKVIGLTATERLDEIGRPIQEQIFKRKYIRTIVQRQNSSNRVELRFIAEKIELDSDQFNKYYDNWKIYLDNIKRYGGFRNMIDYGGMSGYNEGIVAYNKVKKLLSENPQKIQKVIEIIRNNPGTFIIFGDTISMANTIYNSLKKENIKSVKIHTKRGKKIDKDQSRKKREEYLESIRDGSIRVLIGVHAIEEGLDIPDMDNAIFVSIFSPSVLKATQRAGRVMRTRPGKIATIYVLYSDGTVEEKRLPELKKLLGVNSNNLQEFTKEDDFDIEI